jgi:hypothetical protein
MKKISFAAGLMLVIFGAAQAIAFESAIVGGFRGGAAFGLRTEYHLIQSVALRLGVEGSTGDNPLILTLGGHFFNLQLQPKALSPWFIGAGIVNRSGNNSMTGLSVSLIYDPLEKDDPFFGEIGADMLDSPRLVAQLGYYILPDAKFQ